MNIADEDKKNFKDAQQTVTVDEPIDEHGRRIRQTNTIDEHGNRTRRTNTMANMADGRHERISRTNILNENDE